MIDREKVIKGLETCIKYIDQECPIDCPYHEICRKYEGRVVFQPLLRDALALLKEQEPKKIIRKQKSYEDPDGSITYYAEWHCPHCNKVVQKGFDSPWLKYCFNCGKPILWD